MNTAKLKGTMREKDLTQADLAQMINVAISTLNRKLKNDDNGKTFTIGEATKIAEALGLSNEEASNIFFT